MHKQIVYKLIPSHIILGLLRMTAKQSWPIRTLFIEVILFLLSYYFLNSRSKITSDIPLLLRISSIVVANSLNNFLLTNFSCRCWRSIQSNRKWLTSSSSELKRGTWFLLLLLNLFKKRLLVQFCNKNQPLVSEFHLRCHLTKITALATETMLLKWGTKQHLTISLFNDFLTTLSTT